MPRIDIVNVMVISLNDRVGSLTARRRFPLSALSRISGRLIDRDVARRSAVKKIHRDLTAGQIFQSMNSAFLLII